MKGAKDSLQRAVDALDPLYGSQLTAQIPVSAAPLPSDSSPPPPTNALPLYQSQLVESFLRSVGNEVLFLPTGLGECVVVDSIARGMLERHPNKHIVVCVVRPAQALSHADRLRAALGVPVGAFCGGDFLYNFEEEFKQNRVLVFTAGLLMRLAKLGTYRLDSASLLVLHDALSAVRNHPMNTLVREYYWKGTGKESSTDRPRILGIVLPQFQQLQRPFDKLRQLVRKLCHSAQAGVLVPTGPALEALAGRVQHAHIAVHAYLPDPAEEEIGQALQTHSLLVWDTLHAFGQNHFGRLIHFPPTPSPNTPQTNAVGADAPPPSHAARLAHQLGVGAAASPGANSPVSVHSPSIRDLSPKIAGPSSVAPPNAAAYAFDPIHHDWLQIELMVQHSIECSENLPDGEGEHSKSKVAIEVMKHVLLCSRAIRTGLELGVGASLKALLPALHELMTLVDTEIESSNPVDIQLREKLLEVLPTSPLLQWLGSHATDEQALQGPPGTRVAALSSLLQEIYRHETMQRQYNKASKKCRVAIVVGDEAFIQPVKDAVQSTADLKASVGRWTEAGTSAPPSPASDTGDVTAGSNPTSPVTDDDLLLSISLITATEADSPEGRKFLHGVTEAVWFSAVDVLHAAGFDFESRALSVFGRESAVGAGKDAVAGPECHVLATGDQAAAWVEVCRADQLLLAAMQLVEAGDASFEGYLGQLMSIDGHGGGSAAMNVPPPATVLHTLCLGLCGRPPVFSLSHYPGGPRGRDRTSHAVVVLPEEMLAPGNYALPVAFGSEEISFQGYPCDSEPEARDSAAEVALRQLLICGLVAAYWQTRALITQSHQLAMQQQAAAAAAAAAVVAPMRRMVLNSAASHPAALPPSPFMDTNMHRSRGQSPRRRPGPDLTSAVPAEHLICPICGIVTTSEGHLKEHLAGRRHQKNLERLQQQGAAVAAKSNATEALNPVIVEAEEDEEATTPTAQHSANAFLPQRLTSPGPLGSSSGQLQQLSTIDRLPSTLSDAFLRRSTSLHRHSSGNVYDGFPCVRVGDVVLPSSMDLRAFLEEMQQAGELDMPSEGLPPIEEIPQSSPIGGGRGRGTSGGDVPSGGGGGYGSGFNDPNRSPGPQRLGRMGSFGRPGSAGYRSNSFGAGGGAGAHSNNYGSNSNNPGAMYGGGYGGGQQGGGGGGGPGYSPNRTNSRSRYQSRFAGGPSGGGNILSQQDPSASGMGMGMGSPYGRGHAAPAPAMQYAPGMQYPAPMAYPQAVMHQPGVNMMPFMPPMAGYGHMMPGAMPEMALPTMPHSPMGATGYAMQPQAPQQGYYYYGMHPTSPQHQPGGGWRPASSEK